MDTEIRHHERRYHDSEESHDAVMPGRRVYGVTIGLAIMDRRFARPVGDAGNARSFDFPVLYDVVHGLRRLPFMSEQESEERYPLLLDSCQRLVDMGATAVSTTCGFASIYQDRLAQDLSAPVATSSLLQVPTALRLIPADAGLAIIAANAEGVTARHLQGAGITDNDHGRLHIVGLQESEAWRAAVLSESEHAPLRTDVLSSEVIRLCEEARAKHPDIRGFVAEMANLGPYSRALQKATGLPVWDTISLVNWLYQACQHSAS